MEATPSTAIHPRQTTQSERLTGLTDEQRALLDKFAEYRTPVLEADEFKNVILIPKPPLMLTTEEARDYAFLKSIGLL